MLNLIWLGLIVIGVVAGIFTGNVQAVSNAAFDFANTAIEICIGLIGTLTLWTGIMAIAEKAGLITILARVFNPIMKRLFKEIPEGHPAIGAMLLNISANMLGLGDAATPFGLKAIAELDKLNEHKGVASDSMIMFMALNDSCVALIPATIIGLRVAASSANPTEVIGPILVSTAVSTVSAVILVRLFSKMKRYKIENFAGLNESKNENV